MAMNLSCPDFYTNPTAPIEQSNPNNSCQIHTPEEPCTV